MVGRSQKERKPANSTSLSSLPSALKRKRSTVDSIEDPKLAIDTNASSENSIKSTKQPKSTPSTTSTKSLIAKINDLEAECLRETSKLNNIIELIDLSDYKNKSNKDAVIHAATTALTHIFIHHFEKRNLVKPKQPKTAMKNQDDNQDIPAKQDPRTQLRLWLRENYLVFMNNLMGMLGHSEPSLQILALKKLMEFLKYESTNTENGSIIGFPNNVFQKIVDAIVCKVALPKPREDNATWNDHFVNCLLEFLNVNIDLRCYFYKDLAKTLAELMDGSMNAKTGSKTSVKKQKTAANESSVIQPKANLPLTLSTRLYELLSKITALPNDASMAATSLLSVEEVLSEPSNYFIEPDVSQNPLSEISTHKRFYQEAWITFLRLPMTIDTYKKILISLHQTLIPQMTSPQLLCDFLTDSYNQGVGAVSLLALNGLWTLIRDYNLDYPNFYQKLYSLLTRQTLHLRYRSRFFRLTALFLTSTHIPSYMVASFIKRLLRLSLSAPPSAIILILPLVWNLLKRHPATTVLIHRETNNHMSTDPFIMETDEMDKTNALESSIWEITALKSHYSPLVSSMAGIFEEKFTASDYNLEDFLDHTYLTMYEQTVKKFDKKLTSGKEVEGTLAYDLDRKKSGLKVVLKDGEQRVVEPTDERIVLFGQQWGERWAC